MPIDELIANFNPSKFAADTRQAELQPAAIQAEINQRGVQTQQAELQNAVIRRQLANQDALSKAYQAVGVSARPEDVYGAAVKNGMDPIAATEHYKQLVETNRLRAQASLDDQNVQKQQHDVLNGILSAIPDTPQGQVTTPEQQQAWSDYLAAHQKLDPNEQLPAQYPGDNAKKLMTLMHTTQSAQIEQGLKKQQTAAEAAKADESKAQAALHTTEAAIKQKQLDAMNSAGAVGPDRYKFIDQQINPTKHPDLNQGARAAYDSMIKAGASPEDAVKSVAAFATHASQRDTEQDPAILSARRTSAIIEAKALREGDNPALTGVPPAAAASAVSAATKLDADYIKAKEATEAMGRMLDLADKGNVAAGANIPMVGVAGANAINGIKRINSAEIAQYGSAGSLLQKIQGKLEGWTEGQPIPPSVRDDIRELHQQLGEGAWKQYTSGLDSLNKRTGAKFGATQEAPNIRKPAAQAPKSIPSAVQNVLKGAGPGIHTLSDGSKWMKGADGTITAQ